MSHHTTVIQTVPSDQTVLASLEFIKPRDHEKPRFLSAAVNGGQEAFFFNTERRLTCIEDVRRWEQKPRLDVEGFALLKSPSHAGNLYDDAVLPVYRTEVEELVKHRLRAERVVSFDVTRRSDALEGARNLDGARRPAGRIHVDYTEASGPKRAAEVLGSNEVEDWIEAGGRILQVNAWRPIVEPVERSPLALADASSIRHEDLIATDQVFADRVGEIYHLRAASRQRFGYIPHMMSDEVILIKGWDSDREEQSRFTPHSAFELPGQADAAARHSIEVRTFALVRPPG